MPEVPQWLLIPVNPVSPSVTLGHPRSASQVSLVHSGLSHQASFHTGFPNNQAHPFFGASVVSTRSLANPSLILHDDQNRIHPSKHKGRPTSSPLQLFLPELLHHHLILLDFVLVPAASLSFQPAPGWLLWRAHQHSPWGALPGAPVRPSSPWLRVLVTP